MGSDARSTGTLSESSANPSRDPAPPQRSTLPPWMAPLAGLIVGSAITYFGVQEVVKSQLKASERVGVVLGRVEADEQRVTQLKSRVDAVSMQADGLSAKLKQLEQTDAAKVGAIVHTLSSAPNAAALLQHMSAVQTPSLEFHVPLVGTRPMEQDLGSAAFCGIASTRTVHARQACGCVIEDATRPGGQKAFTGKLTADPTVNGRCECQFFCVKYVTSTTR